jgi:hypothetical protein
MNNPLPFLFAVVAGIVILLLIANAIQAKARRDRIYVKYGRTEIAERIIGKTVWVGETEDQLRDSFGAPVDIDEKVLKTKRKQIWKYAHRGGNRYGLRFTVENGIVVGWDEKL